MDALAQELGTKVSRDFFYFMQDCGITHACHNHPVPTALSANFSTILQATYTQWRLFFTYGNVTRFIVGPLVNRTWTNMKAVMRGEPSAKRFRLISGHDLTPIMPLLCTLLCLRPLHTALVKPRTPLPGSYAVCLPRPCYTPPLTPAS